MKKRLKEYTTRLRIILKSELNVNDKITATGAFAVTVLRYSFGIINWRSEEIKNDIKTRKILTTYKMKSSKSDMHRLYVKIKKKMQGLLQIEATFTPVLQNI
jgi:phosphotransferase system IIB component